MTELYPPAPANYQGWNDWTLGHLYQYVQQLLISPGNDDRFTPSAAAGLDDVMVMLASTPRRMESKSRAAKIVFLEEARGLVVDWAPWTHAQLFRLWETIANKPQTSEQFIKDVVERIPQASKDVGGFVAKTTGNFFEEIVPSGTKRNVGLLGLGAIVAVAMMGKAGAIKLR